MKRVLSIFIVAMMLFSMIPAVYAAEPEIIASGTNVAATVAAPVRYTWTASADGTLTVTMGAASPGWRYSILDAAGNTVGLPKSGKTEKSADFELVQGQTYTFQAVGFNSSTWDETSANLTYTLTFVAAEEDEEIEMVEYEVSDKALVSGNNTLSLLDTAYTTIFVYEPSETGIYTFTAPAGAILGYWGAGSWFLTNPNSTTNTYEWTCTGVGQTAYIGVSGVSGNFNLNVSKTGNYEVVEIPLVVYENKATLTPFALADNATLGSYIDVTSEAVYTAVLGEDGYYHLDSEDGDIILVDMNYQDIILSDALKSDRPVMHAYITDEEGNTVKYDIGDAILAYEEVMDGNGYYPLTEDLILFYDVYANGASIYSFYVSGDYNADNVWLYCMRTVRFSDVTEPEVTEPEVTEPEVTEPEVTEPEVTAPEVTEPEISEPEVTEPIETEPAVSYPDNAVLIANGTGVAIDAEGSLKHTWIASANGKLTVSMSAATPGWRYEIKDGAGNTVGLPKSGSTAKSAQFDLIEGTQYTLVIYGWDSANQETAAIYISYAASFVADKEDGDEIEKLEKVVSSIPLVVGNNTLTLDATAIYTLYKFLPTQVGTYTITVPEGATVGYWGASTNYLVNPNSTSNTCEWICSSVGQAAYIGVTGVEGSFILNISLNQTTEPEITEPEVTEPEVTEPEVTEPEEPAPEVSVPNVPADTVYAIVVGDNIAIYNSASNFKNNVSGAASGSTVILYDNINLSSNTLEISNKLVLDLNGYTLSSNKSSTGVIKVTGTLTIEDSSAAGTGAIVNNATSSSYGINVDSSSASLVINNGNISATTQGLRIYNGTLVLNNGTVTATNYAVYVGNTSTAEINGGYINSGFDSFNFVVYAGSSTTVTITGGYFNGSAPSGGGLSGGISGGYFARKVTNMDYLAADCYYEDNLDTTYLFMVINPNAKPEEPEVPAEPDVNVEMWNLVLDNGLLANFYLTLTDDAQVKITVAGETTAYQADSLEKSAEGYYIVPVYLAAAQMTDAIELQIIIDGNVVETKSYTVRQYADIVLTDTTLSAYHSLVKEMLNYGAAAQTYFGYNTANLANAGIAATATNEIPEVTDDVIVNGNVSGIKYAGATLVYRDKIAVRLYFSGDINGITFTANRKTYSPIAKDGMFYVEINDILPQNLDQQITMIVADASGNTLTVTYGPMNYIVRMNAKGSESLQELLKALYNYHLAAKELQV